MLTEPIVEGAYYEVADGVIIGPLDQASVVGWCQDCARQRIVRRVYLVPSDPAEVVAELRQLELAAGHTEPPGGFTDGRESAFGEGADLVAEKLLGGKS